MHPFNIFNFKSASLPQIQEHLFKHDTLRYEITIPKQELDLNNTDFLRKQYYMAAYAGHRLSLVSTSFAYAVPCPYRFDPFRFEIENIDPRKLAFTLHQITKGYYGSDEEAEVFRQETLKHFLNCFTDKTESTCWGLLHIANKKNFAS
jgi:hypothetical protein